MPRPPQTAKINPMKMTIDQDFIKTLQEHGIKHAFGVTGAAMMFMSGLYLRAGIAFLDCAHEGPQG